MARYIDADAIERELQEEIDFETSMYSEEQNKWFNIGLKCAMRDVKSQPTADVVEVDKVAEMLRLMLNDDCACNYNGNDEWLPLKCKYASDECPMPKERLGCWKEFVKHFLAKMDGKE